MNSSFWLELLARSAALLVAGELIFHATRRWNAAWRHRFLFWVLALLALLPVLAVVLPEMPLSLWRAEHAQKTLVTVLEMSSRSIGTSPGQAVNWLLLVWMAGAVVASLPLMIGVFSIWKIVGRAKPLTAEILISTELHIPLTCGVVRPRILLPADAEHWSASRLQAVLLHERAHIRRRDVATQVAAHIVASLWWFQPLVWVMRRRLRTQSEFACDAEALRSGFRATDYASELLAVAKSAGRNCTIPGPAIAMARTNDLEDRVRTVLDPSKSVRTYVSGVVFAGLILGGTAIAASAVNFRASDSVNESGGSMMKRTIFSALLTSAGLSAATVSGTVHDTSGTAIADAKVVLSNPDTAAKDEAATGVDGKFSFSGSSAGQYILRIEKPGYTSLFRAFDVKAESNMQREFTMPNEGGQAVADNVVAGDDPQPKKIRVGGQVAQSNLLRKVTPVYPAAAKTAHVQGPVEIEAVISGDGVPVDLRVISSPSDDLSASAMEAVAHWRYRPTLLNGSPVEITTTVLVNYTLSQ